MMKKRIIKKKGQQRKRKKRDNVDDNGKEQLRKYESKGKKVITLMMKKRLLKKEDDKRKKERYDNLDNDEKEQLRKYEKKGNKVICDNLEAGEKEKVRKIDRKRKMDKRLKTFHERSSIFDNVQMCSMADTCILTTPAFRLIEEDFEGAIQEGPSYISTLLDICWKFEF